MRRLLYLLPCGLALAALLPGARPARSQQPGLPAGLVPDATGVPPAAPVTAAGPVNPFPITPEAGPWLICASSYVGPDSPELARQLCVEVRTRFKMPAYIFNHADEERRLRRERMEELHKAYPGVHIPYRGARIQEQCAVLVGGYQDFESAGAALPAVKRLPMPKLVLGEGKSAYDQMNVFEPDPTSKRSVVKERADINPFTTAMVVHNPALPLPAKQAAKYDPAWKELNSEEEYSLLRVSRPYTLVVKEYTGVNVVHSQSMSSSFLRTLGLGGQKPGEGLTAAAMQAHELAKFLRHPSLGFDAHVLHTRDRSIVTVGAFAALHDADMERVTRQVAAVKFSAAQGGKDPVGLMANPIPMEVPRP